MTSPITVDELFTPLTAAQIRSRMVLELIALDIPADKWRAGGVASTILTVTSMLLALLSLAIVEILQGFFLPTATGGGLKALAYYVYGITVSDATFATGVATLTNGGGGAYTKAIGAYSLRNPTTNAVYVNSEAFSLSSGQVLDVAFRAVDAGSAGNSIPGTITEQVTALLGVTVTNAAAFVGTDAPTDAAIRQLCTNKLASLSVRGVRTAYAYAIQTAINPVTLGAVNINRWAITENSHIGEVLLYVAAPSGVVDPNDLIGVQTRIEEVARPCGVEADAVAATGVPYTRALTIYASARAGTTADDVKTACDAAILTFLSGYEIGGVAAADNDNTSFQGLFGEGIAGACAQGCATIGAKFLSVRGNTDLALASTEVAEDDVTTTVTLVASSSGAVL